MANIDKNWHVSTLNAQSSVYITEDLMLQQGDDIRQQVGERS